VFVDCGRRTMHKCYNLYYTVEMLTACDVTAVIDAKVTYWSKIVIFAPVRRSPLEYCHNLCYRKTRMAWVPDDEKILKICLLVSTEYMNITDRQTDQRTDTLRRHRPCLCIASCSKNWPIKQTDVIIFIPLLVRVRYAMKISIEKNIPLSPRLINYS